MQKGTMVLSFVVSKYCEWVEECFHQLQRAGALDLLRCHLEKFLEKQHFIILNVLYS